MVFQKSILDCRVDMKLIWCNGFPEIYTQLQGEQLTEVYVHATICKTTLV